MDSEQSTSQRMVFAVKDGPPSQAVVDAVATAEERDPIELSPLYDSIDTDALDALLEDPQGIDVTFRYEGYTIVIRENAEVLLEPFD